ncbi:hypothetical protein, partial [Mycobacterium tuberculosis]|uniref:hypothetical protein n=1 Tax=Mycobacterium tuberculosis TaxID=1773 RepID=UPI001BDB9E57
LAAAIKEKKELEQKLDEANKRQEEQKKNFDEWAAKKADELRRFKDDYESEAAKRLEQEQQLVVLQDELEKAKEAGDDKAIAKLR